MPGKRRFVRSIAGCIAVAAGMVFVTPNALAEAPAEHTASTGDVDGYWRTDGYGTILAIRDGHLRTYDTTAVSCASGVVSGEAIGETEARSASFATNEGAIATVSRRGFGKARFVTDDNVSYRDLSRIAALPTNCDKGAKDPLTTFDVFWQTYAENYPFFAAKGIDWNAVRARYRPLINSHTTDNQLFSVMRDMIAPLNDGHTGITDRKNRRFGGRRPDTPKVDGALVTKINAAIKANVGDPIYTGGDGAITFAKLANGLGYLRITRFTGYTDDDTYASDTAELDRALNAVFTKENVSGKQAWRGLVIDVRFNGGGSDALALRVASRLTERSYTAYSKRTRNNPTDTEKFTEPQKIRVVGDNAAYLGPVAVLTGNLDISAGEGFVQALMGRPGTIRIGDNTQGCFSDLLERNLPNGWLMQLPNEEYLNAQGETYDGAGIPPRIHTPVFTPDELANGKDSALARAREVLGG